MNATARTASIVASVGIAVAVVAGCSSTDNASKVTATVTQQVAAEASSAAPTSKTASSSKAPAMVKIPEGLVGTNAQLAMEKLEKLGFTKVMPSSVDEKAKVPVLLTNWTVVAVEPGVGETVESDSTVVLKVEKPNN